MDTLMLPLIAALALAGAIVSVFVAVSHQRELSQVRTSLSLVRHFGSTGDSLVPILGDRPGYVALPLVRLAQSLSTARMRERLRLHLAWGGKITSDDLNRVLERKVIYGGLGFCISALLAFRAGGATWVLLPLLTLGGYALPDLLVYNRGTKRGEEISRELPDALDLLNLCVESGLSLQAALSRVSESNDGPVAVEFARVLQEMQVGVSRHDAFESLASRTKQQDLRRFVTAMLQVDQLGIPVASVLREQAMEMRLKRKARARERAQKVPVTMLAPLMLCFLPGLFIVILGPAFIRILGVLSHQ